MNLDKKVVLVTGASKGIGAATAIAFAKESASVFINFRSDIKAGQAVLDECNRYSKGNFLVQANVSKEDEVEKMFKIIRTESPRLDILINNAGIYDDNDTPTNIESLENIFRNNFLSCFTVTKYALDLLKKGKIVNVSSIHGRLGFGRPKGIAYAAFKAALESYTKNLARSLAPDILVNAVAPGRVVTAKWDIPDIQTKEKLGQAHLIKRMIQPEEIADGIIFLVKNDAVCGEILTIDGGMSLVLAG